jgi:Cu/Ag efflux pump CusA
MDEGGYVVDYVTPAGTSLDETDRMLRRIEKQIAAMLETQAFSRRTGAEMGLFATEQNTGDILVKLKARSERKRAIDDVVENLRGWIGQNIPGIDVEFIQVLQDMLSDLEGAKEPVELKIFGSDMGTLEQVADEVGPRLEKIRGIVDFKGLQKGESRNPVAR